jgi:hypothetical protein
VSKLLGAKEQQHSDKFKLKKVKPFYEVEEELCKIKTLIEKQEQANNWF